MSSGSVHRFRQTTLFTNVFTRSSMGFAFNVDVLDDAQF
jgi:hypothetical protein